MSEQQCRLNDPAGIKEQEAKMLEIAQMVEKLFPGKGFTLALYEIPKDIYAETINAVAFSNTEPTLAFMAMSALAEQMGSTITDKAINYEIEDVDEKALKKDGLFMPYCKGGNA